MIKLVKKEEAIEKKVAPTYSVFQMLTSTDSNNLSMVISKATNHKEVAFNTKSDRLYYILKGEVKARNMNSEGAIEKEITAKTGDLIFISANTKYEFSGTFEAVQVLSPPFSPDNEPLNINGNPK
jgi:ethanolamine utilization protein EutQ (cupin superfamily)